MSAVGRVSGDGYGAISTAPEPQEMDECECHPCCLIDAATWKVCCPGEQNRSIRTLTACCCFCTTSTAMYSYIFFVFTAQPITCCAACGLGMLLGGASTAAVFTLYKCCQVFDRVTGCSLSEDLEFSPD